MTVFNIYMTNMIILSQSVTRECRAFTFGVCSACGALGALIGITLSQIIHDNIGHDALFLQEIFLCVAFLSIYYGCGGQSQFVPRKKHDAHRQANLSQSQIMPT